MPAEIEPQLKDFDAKTAQQMPMMIAMGQGFAQSAIQQSKDLNDLQRFQQAQAMRDAIAGRAQTVKFTDPALVKSAIAISKTARDLNLKSTMKGVHSATTRRCRRQASCSPASSRCSRSTA